MNWRSFLSALGLADPEPTNLPALVTEATRLDGVIDLRELLLLYVSGAIGHEPFREQFVSRFLSASDSDPLVGHIYNVVESECSAFSLGFVDEVAFKLRLLKLTSQIAVQNLSP